MFISSFRSTLGLVKVKLIRQIFWVRSLRNYNSLLSLAIFLTPLVARATTPIPDDCLTRMAEVIASPTTQVADVEAYYHATNVLGGGNFGEVREGILPPHFETAIEKKLEGWYAGMPVAIKIPKSEDLARSQWALVHEANVIEKITPHDPKHYFLRGTRDKTHNVLVTELREGFVPVRGWVKNFRTPEEIASVCRQLDEMLGVLQSSEVGLVHSDINWNNVAINPKTKQIFLADYAHAASPGGYPPATPPDQRRGGADPDFSNANVAYDGPADFKDDIDSVNKLKETVRRAKFSTPDYFGPK